jgi:uncharacterized pyridoxal phosphate-containing UPF0001 family protein
MAPLNVCIQVNVDGGATKSGVMAEQALELAEAMVKLPNLQLRGIMSIPDDLLISKRNAQSTKGLHPFLMP